MKHTPAPWSYEVELVSGPSLDTTHLFAHGEVLGKVYGPSAQANARLIAAAPDLLEALLAYVTAQSRMSDKWAEGDDNVKRTLWKNLHACEYRARDAIAKAT